MYSEAGTSSRKKIPVAGAAPKEASSITLVRGLRRYQGCVVA